MKNTEILWVDDEIDLLKIHILYLEEKGYSVTPCNNGEDAIEIVEIKNFDNIFLDEKMPGKSGLEVLAEVKQMRPNTPVVMITKSEEEDIMDEAIGSSIDDYLIKPVNPKQIILSIKKNVDNKRLISEKTTSSYQTQFAKLTMMINEAQTHEDWAKIYKRLVYWELELERLAENTMDEVLAHQKEQANSEFVKFIKRDYVEWYAPDNENRPKLPFDFFRKKVFPVLDSGEKAFVIVIDNLRWDQWKTMQPLIEEFMHTDADEIWYTSLPTATQYARNSLFAGLTPLEISKRYPELWLHDHEEGGKNMNETKLFQHLLDRYRRKFKFGYEKILNNKTGNKVNENIDSMLSQNDLNIAVYNFVDILSHARTEMKMIRELADSDAAYRSLTMTWFEHSPLLDLIKILAANKIKTFITTDHGTINVTNPVKVVGDRDTTTNLRYKQGKNLSYKSKEVFEITKPEKAGLPASTLSSSYIFACQNDFFAYPNNYNYYVRYYKDTFQHGGVSLEEMLIPVITLSPK